MKEGLAKEKKHATKHPQSEVKELAWGKPPQTQAFNRKGV